MCLHKNSIKADKRHDDNLVVISEILKCFNKSCSPQVLSNAKVLVITIHFPLFFYSLIEEAFPPFFFFKKVGKLLTTVFFKIVL